jgi:hypothetical protein
LLDVSWLRLVIAASKQYFAFRLASVLSGLDLESILQALEGLSNILLFHPTMTSN